MDTRSTLVGYDFTEFSKDFVQTNQHHPHVVRRPQATTHIDRFALEQIMDINAVYYEQYLQGWSRSYYLTSRHLEEIHKYNSNNTSFAVVDQHVYRQAIQAAKNGLRSLPIVRAYDVLTELDSVSYKPSSAAGYDYIGAKGPLNGINHNRAISRAKAVLWSAIKQDGEGIEHVIHTSVPDVSYTRTQLADLTEKTKVRQVWGRSFHYILLEGIVADPFIQAITQSDTFIHTGQDPTISVPQLLSKVAGQSQFIYSIDWKTFDASVSRFEINAAFDIIKTKVSFPNLETEQAFEITRQLFIHKKIAAPDGLIYEIHKGIPSGSYYTSLIGSIINKLRIEYLWRVTIGHGPKVCYTLGDDSLSGDNHFLSPSKMSEVANPLGWFLNPDKTEYSRIPENVSFLGRTFLGGLNTRNLKRCLRLLVYPEFPVDTGEISAYRAQSIAHDAGGLSELLNKVANRLKRRFGVASQEEVPSYFKLYYNFNRAL